MKLTRTVVAATFTLLLLACGDASDDAWDMWGTKNKWSNDSKHVDVEAIWNGATEVDRWLVLAGKHPWALRPAGGGDWDGLATTIDARTNSPWVKVVALNDSGRAIGRSPLVHVSS